MSNPIRISAGSLPLLCGFIATVSASPLPANLFKRNLTAGAQAGLAIGIVVAIIIVGLIVTFFIIHMRRNSRDTAINRTRAALYGEKNPDGTDRANGFGQEPEVTSMPRRTKSVKDRLMGPLYRESMALPKLPRAKIAANNRASTMTTGDDESFLNKPWTGGESARPSFSSKRATRMMMMM